MFTLSSVFKSRNIDCTSVIFDNLFYIVNDALFLVEWTVILLTINSIKLSAVIFYVYYALQLLLKTSIKCHDHIPGVSLIDTPR